MQNDQKEMHNKIQNDYKATQNNKKETLDD